MEYIRLETEEAIPRSRLWDSYFAGRKTCVLDIETTGLDRRRSKFILGGLYDPEAGVLHQIFAEDPSEEEEALAAFMDLTSRFDVAVTYNGRHFDLPFLEERIRRTGLDKGMGSRDAVQPYDGYDLDLYQVVNGHSPLRQLLPNLRQKTVEDYMGLWSDRSDEISGAESVELYAHFTATGDPDARSRILLHNSDDVLQLTRLIGVIGKSDFHKAMYHMGFPAGKPEHRWQVQRIRTVRNQLLMEGIQGAARIDYRGFCMGDFPLQTFFDACSGTFRMEIPILRRAGIAAVDLRAAGLSEKEFQKYPAFGSGFLVIEEQNGVQYREINHLVRTIISRFGEQI